MMSERILLPLVVAAAALSIVAMTVSTTRQLDDRPTTQQVEQYRKVVAVVIHDRCENGNVISGVLRQAVLGNLETLELKKREGTTTPAQCRLAKARLSAVLVKLKPQDCNEQARKVSQSVNG